MRDRDRCLVLRWCALAAGPERLLVGRAVRRRKPGSRLAPGPRLRPGSQPGLLGPGSRTFTQVRAARGFDGVARVPAEWEETTANGACEYDH